MDITRVGVLGGGIMGTGMAVTCLLKGLDVVLAEQSAERAERARDTILRDLDRALSRLGPDDGEQGDPADRLAVTDDVQALADRQLVIEAIIEDPDAKVAAFTMLDQMLADPEAILASNTSSIPIMKLATATSRPDRVVGLHFFNPVPVMDLVEVVPSLLTSPETEAQGTRFVTDTLGKRAIRCEDRAGFVVNALLIPYLLAAVRMYESGFATVADIDVGMREGCRHPMGPLELCDLIGLDTVLAVAESMYEEFKEPLYAPPPLLNRMVDAGLLGRKSGRGFLQHAG